MPYIVVRMVGKKAVPVDPRWVPIRATPKNKPFEISNASDANYWAEYANQGHPQYDAWGSPSGYVSDGYKYQVRKLQGDTEWPEREKERFGSGHYKPVPWHKTKWARKAPKKAALHFVHIAQKDQTKIAFTESNSKGEFDRKTVMSPKKYLKRFYGKLISERILKRWLGAYKKLYGPNDRLEFAYTAEEIYTVYKSGPRSCMTGCARVRAYAGPDLAVAYVRRKGKIVARSVVWPKRKLHTRMYGNAELMKSLFEEAGYKRAQFKGARLTNLPGTPIPSLDCARDYKVSPQYITLR